MWSETAKAWRPITAGVALLVVVVSGLTGMSLTVAVVALLVAFLAYPSWLLAVLRAVLPWGGRRG